MSISQALCCASHLSRDVVVGILVTWRYPVTSHTLQSKTRKKIPALSTAIELFIVCVRRFLRSRSGVPAARRWAQRLAAGTPERLRRRLGVGWIASQVVRYLDEHLHESVSRNADDELHSYGTKGTDLIISY